MTKKLAIITTHPVQYNAPWFRLLANEKNIDVKVFYTWSQSKDGNKYDPGFNKVIEWDIPLLEGYEYEFIKNTSTKPGSHHFKGINNPDLNKKINEWKPDAVLVIGWSFKSHLSCMRYFKGKVPVYFRGDSNLLDEPLGISLKKIARNVVLHYVYNHVDKAFYVGENNKQYYLKFGLKKNQLIYAPHAIDNVRFQENENHYEESAKKWRQQLGINKDALVFVFAGKLEPKKSPLILLESFIQANIKEGHLIFIGNGILESKLKRLAADHPNIHFIDFQNQSQMPVAYRLGDVFVLPSAGPGETWGLAINEAMACGRTVIASDKCGGAIDLIDEGKGGYIFKNDAGALKVVLAECYSNKTELQKMGDYNLKKIRSFSFNNIVKAVVSELLQKTFKFFQ